LASIITKKTAKRLNLCGTRHLNFGRGERKERKRKQPLTCGELRKLGGIISEGGGKKKVRSVTDRGGGGGCSRFLGACIYSGEKKRKDRKPHRRKGGNIGGAHPDKVIVISPQTLFLCKEDKSTTKANGWKILRIGVWGGDRSYAFLRKRRKRGEKIADDVVHSTRKHLALKKEGLCPHPSTSGTKGERGGKRHPSPPP